MELTERLQKHLDGKLSLLGRLETVLLDERGAIVALDLEAMEQIDARKREVIRELEQNGEEGRRIIRELADEKGLSPDTTLTGLLETLPPLQRKPLATLQAKVLERGKSVDRQITINRDLLVSSLRTVNASLDFFHRMFTLGTTYGEGGKITEESGVRLVSREA